MINLSKRLNMIASMITSDDVVLDVGCDHALLDIYLSNKYNKIYYASDIRKSALSMAEDNIKKYNASNVKLLCGNGLETINDSINTVVIAGMGYMTIEHILKKIPKYVNKLVIQSNTDPEKTRKLMLKKGFYIDEEHIVLDKGIYYIVASYKRGHKHYTQYEKEIGIASDDILGKYLDVEIKKYNILLKVVPKNQFIRRYQIKKKIKYLNKKKNSIC